MFSYKNAIHNQNECVMHKLRSSAFSALAKNFSPLFPTRRSVIFKKEFLRNKSDVSEITFLIWSTMTKVCANSSLRIFIQVKQLFKLTLHVRCNHASDKAGHQLFHSMTHGRRKSRVRLSCLLSIDDINFLTVRVILHVARLLSPEPLNQIRTSSSLSDASNR